jgi:hypothetical protein
LQDRSCIHDEQTGEDDDCDRSDHPQPRPPSVAGRATWRRRTPLLRRALPRGFG